jgi:DNA modification methylase
MNPPQSAAQGCEARNLNCAHDAARGVPVAPSDSSAGHAAAGGLASTDAYIDFLRRKVPTAPTTGFDVDLGDINPRLPPHVRAIVPWLLSGGRRALFASFGLQKTVAQLETVRLAAAHADGVGLIVLPLGVRQEFRRDAVERLGWKEPPRFIRSIEECESTGVYLTNYETVRDGKIDPRHFAASSLDEAACLRGFGGTKTFREFMRLFAGDGKTLNARVRSAGVRYRFVATATPSPNDYIELLAYAAYLDIMDVSAAKTRFFKRDSTKADQLTIHPHKVREFWLWVASWALFITRPSDLGAEYSDEGYNLPALDLRWHEVPSDHSEAGTERDGQGRLFRNAAGGVVDASREKRDSIGARVEKLQQLRSEDLQAHRILWHDLESEREAIEAAVPGVATVYGSQDLDAREQIVIDFSDGKIPELGAKPVMLGAGTNLQRFCHWAIFLGIGFKFADFIQAIHRLRRFGQQHQVRVDLIYTEAEREIRADLERKWTQHDLMVQQMTELIREYGLSQTAMMSTLTRALGVERVEVAGEKYRLVNNDCVLEARGMADDSVDLILTSIPFSTQYEYSPNYADFGHSDNNAHFFEQMDFLTPHMLRTLKPGRLAAIHVKDRIVPGGMTGLGFQTVYPFHARCIEHYTRHGFAYMGMKTIVTDVVRENNQTYRLGWTEQCKDGSKMGVGMPEYLLIFRRPPTDTSNSYADHPVVKDKGKYSRSRWQVDAHAFARSAGNRLLRPEELEALPHDAIFKMFREYSLTRVYDFEHHVRVGEALEASGRLPVTFMLLQPQSWSPEVWTDITRMLTLNGAQSAAGREMHLCPMQFDLADRAIAQWTEPGDLVWDPFSGLGTVPYRAILQGRRGLGTELSHRYFIDAAAYCAAAEREMAMPDLFSVLEDQANAGFAA